jgi:hypothetical protein
MCVQWRFARIKRRVSDASFKLLDFFVSREPHFLVEAGQFEESG